MKTILITFVLSLSVMIACDMGPRYEGVAIDINTDTIPASPRWIKWNDDHNQYSDPDGFKKLHTKTMAIMTCNKQWLIIELIGEKVNTYYSDTLKNKFTYYLMSNPGCK